jgi:hypothetical protein
MQPSIPFGDEGLSHVGTKMTTRRRATKSLMRQIYQSASWVIVWDNTWMNAWRTLDIVHELAMAQINYVSPAKMRENYVVQRNSAQWLCLKKLLRHGWFGRVWMIQEVVLASKVHVVYGGNYIDLNHLMALANTVM